MNGEDLRRRLGELAALFLKIGATGFGGPAALIAMTELEVVERRRWLTRDHFMDLMGATNLIPGPNATEIAIHVGYIRAGWPGLIVAGVCFILPAALVTTCFAWAYVRFGSLPQIAPFLYGIKPAVLAVMVAAVGRLGKAAVKSWRLLLLGLIVAVALALGTNESVALLAGGIAGMLWLRLSAPDAPPDNTPAPTMLASIAAIGVPLWRIGLFFLKVGAVLYGSGYVLVAFLDGELVHDYGWLTQQQLLDAIAIGQFTPGPVSSAATFIGYLLARGPGAVVATVAIFLPSFFFVAALHPLIPRLRRSHWSAAFLDAVNISSVALMAVVIIRLAWATLISWPALLIALAAAGVSLRWKVNPLWLVAGGALVGWLLASWAV